MHGSSCSQSGSPTCLWTWPRTGAALAWWCLAAQGASSSAKLLLFTTSSRTPFRLWTRTTYKLRPSRYALPRPEGQRCLVVASEGCTVSRTRAGRLLHTFPSALPGGARGGDASGGGPCILDCVFHEPAGTYFVQDIMCWKGYTLCDCSAEFRLFWLHTKLAEGGASSARSKRHRYPFVPLTAYTCDPGVQIHKVAAQQLSRAG